MKVKMEHIFDVPVDKFDELWNDKEVIDNVVAKLPNVKKREVIEEENKGGVVYRKVLYEGEAEIPDIVKGAVKPDMLKWYEITTYYPDKKEYEFEMVPVFFKDKIHFKGKIKLVPEGNKTKRIIEGELKVSFNPLANKIIEKFMKDYLEKNMAVEAKVLSEEMSKKLKALA
jgi:hypothetical protein